MAPKNDEATHDICFIYDQVPWTGSSTFRIISTSGGRPNVIPSPFSPTTTTLPTARVLLIQTHHPSKIFRYVHHAASQCDKLAITYRIPSTPMSMRAEDVVLLQLACAKIFYVTSTQPILARLVSLDLHRSKTTDSIELLHRALKIIASKCNEVRLEV